MSEKLYLGFILAGVYNFSILIFSKLFTNDLGKYDDLFNFNGVIMVILWGMAYISIYKNFRQVPFLNFVFFIEKMYFVIKWVTWMGKNSNNLNNIFKDDILTGIFYTVYGIGDFVFGIFFLAMAISSFKRSSYNAL
jgi:hypothetical protein